MPTVKNTKKRSVTKKRSTKKLVKSKGLRRPVVYPEFGTVIHAGDNAMLVDQAKEYLGWREEEDKEPFGNRYLLKHNDKKIRCDNNVNNRPLYTSVINTLKQEHLRKRWVFNGEPIVITETGIIYNGQHTLISFVEAVDEYNENPDDYPEWSSEPTLEKLVVYGIKENEKTANTYDTAKSRSEADVIYRMPYFREARSEKERRVCSKLTQHAVKLLWHRLGGHSNAFSVKRTHAEMISFLDRHSRVIEAVRHIYEEDDEGNISKWITPGYASGMLYLMATSNSEPEAYFLADEPGENLLDFGQWDKACEFFVLLAQKDKSLMAIRDVFTELQKQEMLIIIEERLAVIAGAWYRFKYGKKVTKENIMPEYIIEEDKRELLETPSFGGIDLGDNDIEAHGKKPRKGDPSKETIAKKSKKIREKKFPVKHKARKEHEDKWTKGDRAWVHDSQTETYFAELLDDPFDSNDGIRRAMVEDVVEGAEYEVYEEWLSLKQFEPGITS